MNIKTREQIALELLAYKIETQLREGCEVLSLADVNEVLFTGHSSVVDPKSKREVEVR